MAISTLLFDKAPYKNVIVLGHVQDKDGQKMSKSKGNAVDPMDALNKYGADAIRWYFYSNSAPWLPNRFHEDAVVEGQRKFMGTLWNTYAFFVLYANIDNFDASKYVLAYEKLSVMDKWLLSKLNTVIKEVDNNLSNYRIPEAARALDDFVDDMSNWYVRRSRERFWAKGMEQDKINAYMTLYTALVTISKAAAPMIPFMNPLFRKPPDRDHRSTKRHRSCHDTYTRTIHQPRIYDWRRCIDPPVTIPDNMLNHCLQSFLRRKSLLIAPDHTIPLYKNIRLSIDHDLRYRLIFQKLRQHIQPPKAVKQLHPQTDLFLQRNILILCLFEDAPVDHPRNLCILHIPCQIQFCRHTHFQSFPQRS